MVMTTRAQAARGGVNPIPLNGTPPAAPAYFLRSQATTLPAKARDGGADPSAAFRGSSPIEFLDLTGDDVVLPGGSANSQCVDLTGEGSADAAVELPSAAEVLTISAKKKKLYEERSRGVWWDEEESGPRHLSLRDTTHATREKTERRSPAKIARRSEREGNEKQETEIAVSSIPTPIGNNAVAAIMRKEMLKLQVRSNSAFAGAQFDSESTETASTYRANRTLTTLRTS
jgi:hypothetical protein